MQSGRQQGTGFQEAGIPGPDAFVLRPSLGRHKLPHNLLEWDNILPSSTAKVDRYRIGGLRRTAGSPHGVAPTPREGQAVTENFENISGGEKTNNGRSQNWVHRQFSRRNSSTTKDELLVLQFNMFGWMGYRGGHQIAHATAKTISERKPSVVTLNEVCLSQIRKLVQKLEEWGLGYQYHHDFILHREDKQGSCDFGNAVAWLSDRPEEREPETYLSIPWGEQPRKLLGVKIHCLRLPTVIAVTHLTSSPAEAKAEIRRRQIMEVAGCVSSWTREGFEVILGGDFNEEPDSPKLDPLYLPSYGGGSNGICHEASCRGKPNPRIRRRPFKPTTDAGRKYDYIFMTTGYLPMGSRVTHSGSDHHPYLGRIGLQVEPSV